MTNHDRVPSWDTGGRDVFGPTYHKIQTVFMRDERNLIIPGLWSMPELEYLQDCPWNWTEKVDGTNIRVHWNGTVVTIGGRTDNAQVPSFLLAELQAKLTVDVLMGVFGEAKTATVYGEGYGPKIQKGAQYGERRDLIIFDVRVGDWWLHPNDVADVASRLGLDVVPSIGNFTLNEAVRRVRENEVVSLWPTARIEGLVGKPLVDLYSRKGERVVAKIKRKDFLDLERRGAKR